MGLAIKKYSPREGLEVSLLLGNEPDIDAAKRLVNSSSINSRKYQLAMLEGVNGNNPVAQAIVELSIADVVDDPFISPIGRESFEIFRKLPEHLGISIDGIAARYVGAFFFRYSLDPSTGDMNGFLRMIFNDYSADLPAQIRSHIVASQRHDSHGETSLTNLYKLLRGVKERTAQRIANNLASNSGNVLVYCGRGYRESVEKAIETLKV